MERNPKIERRLHALLSIILVALPLITIYVIFHFRGPQWDLIAHSLLGRTALNYIALHNVNIHPAFIGEYLNNLVYYNEPYRAPLATPIFATLSVFFSETVLPYMVIVYAAAVLALYKTGRALRIDTLILFAAFLNPYALYFFFVPNGMEGLSIIFVLLGITALAKRSSTSGIFFGLASLAKYPAIIFLPLIILLWDRKKITFAATFEFLMLLPWLLFNYIVYGNPIYSYLAAVSNVITSGGYAAVHPLAVLAVVAYPAAFAAAAFVLWHRRHGRLNVRIGYRGKVLLAFAALALVGYAFVLPHNDFFTQERFGYLFFTALVLLSVSFLSKETMHKAAAKRNIAIIAIAILCVGLAYTYITSNTAIVKYYNPNNPDNIYQAAYGQLSNLGFENCRFITNAWVPMLYQQMSAYSPFVRYSSSVITPIVAHLSNASGIGYANFSNNFAKYPIIVIQNAGVPEQFIIGLKNSTLKYNSGYIQIYLPKNATCYPANLTEA
jgi:hypothetical protein